MNRAEPTAEAVRGRHFGFASVHVFPGGTGSFAEAFAEGGLAMIGGWMGSQYDVGGRRYDYRLFLDHDGRYERTV